MWTRPLSLYFSEQIYPQMRKRGSDSSTKAVCIFLLVYTHLKQRYLLRERHSNGKNTFLYVHIHWTISVSITHQLLLPKGGGREGGLEDVWNEFGKWRKCGVDKA